MILLRNIADAAVWPVRILKNAGQDYKTNRQQDKRNRNKEADIMDKRVLEEYIDACEVIKDAEEEIRKLESKKRITANETVSGSNPEFPYNPQHFKVQGTTYSYSDDVRLQAKKEVLKQKKEKAEELKLQVEVWMISIPFRMQRIIKYKIFEDMTWQQVADRMGRKVTEASVKMEFKRFFEKIKVCYECYLCYDSM